MFYLFLQFLQGDEWNEGMLAMETNRSRYDRKTIQGLSMRTVVAYGPNAAKSYYYPPKYPRSSTRIDDKNVILVDSGGQYLDGTTTIARTIHLGEPTMEQKKAYTNVLTGLIRLSLLVFPDDTKPVEIDTLIRSPLWQNRHDYHHFSGHGIGSYLSVEECELHRDEFTIIHADFNSIYALGTELKVFIDYPTPKYFTFI
jgi:Xaa-Pro aminopeptidase